MSIATRTFRVFVSSTFEDLVEERNALQREVFPRLREVCEEHGARFQAVDLRWGVRDEAVLGQKMMEICLAEIERCQRTKIKPNFIVLLGDRYGKPPLPARIQAQEFETVLRWIAGEDRALVESWYQRDDNAVPPEYLLRPRTGGFVDPGRWEQIEQHLHQVLLEAARAAGLTGGPLVKYHASATHQEILKGLGATPEDRRHTFAFVRSTNFDEDPRLRELKEFLRGQLGKDVFEYASGDLVKLCKDVSESLEKIILHQVSRFEARPPLDLEVEAHNAFARERGRFFTGRIELLRRLSEHLKGPDGRPVLVQGESGSGKSAVLAVASDAAAGAEPNRIVIRRFIGATPSSSDGVSLLRSICSQLADIHGRSREYPSTFNELVSTFQEELQAAPADRPVLLFIDGLNQLGPLDPVATHPWLPGELPPHCCIVVSATDIPQNLRHAEVLKIEPFRPEEAEELLSAWLSNAQRTLQIGQRRKLLESFSRLCPLPIYLKLLFEESRNWRSFDAVEDCAVGKGLDGVIDRMIDRLSDDANHGSVLVSRALGYLSAARRGLGELELLALLSRDNVVWSDFRSRTRHEPPQRQLPPIVWSRLFFDLEPYLTELAGSEGHLLTFYHGHIHDRISERFLSGESRALAHRSLAEHFRRKADPEGRGEWNGNSARALRELPFHTAGSNNQVEVVSLLTSLAYLSARVSAGGAYQLAEDYALTDGSPELLEWRDFILRHSQRLTDHPKMLVALVQHEGFPSARLQVPSRTWRYPWLKSWEEAAPLGRLAPPGLHLEIKAQKQFPHGRVGAVAWQAGLIFSVERLGSISITDYRDMQELLTRVAVGTGRPVKIACAPDASSLLVIFEPGEAELHRCTLGSDGRPVASELVARFRCSLPEIDNPVVEWHRRAYWMQIRPGMLASVDAATAEIHEEPLCGSAPGELSALLFLKGGRTFTAVRQGHSTILGGTDAVSARHVASELCAACACGDRTAAFFADGHAAVFDVTDGPIETATIRAGIVRGAAGWDGDRLFWLKELPDFARLHGWRPGEGEARLVDGGQKVFPAGLHVIPRTWGGDSEGGTLVLTTHSIVRLHVVEGGSLRAGRLDLLFGGPTWLAVRKEDSAQWLWDSHGREVCLGMDVPGRLYCAPDGRGFFYTVRVDRPGLVWDLASLQTAPLSYRPMMLNMAAGDPELGCWFSDRKGGIYYAGDDRELRLAATVEEGVGGTLEACGKYLLWRGTIPHYYPDMGVEQTRAFVFFRRRPGTDSPLERIGERLFAVQEGLCITLDYDRTRGRLVLLWQPEGKYPVLRTATVEEFLTDRFVERKLQNVGLLGNSRIALSPDGRALGIINSGRELVCVSIDTGELVATLAGSLPFTHIAPGGEGTSFWLVQAQDTVYGCTLVEPV
jgi:hypothetical protein